MSYWVKNVYVNINYYLDKRFCVIYVSFVFLICIVVWFLMYIFIGKRVFEWYFSVDLIFGWVYSMKYFFWLVLFLLLKLVDEVLRWW